jgi:hypothetical protein
VDLEAIHVADDHQRRVLYSKNTIVNDFIVALEVLGPQLGPGSLTGVAGFLVHALAVLDRITDGKMIYDAPAHLLAVLWKLDTAMAVRLASELHEKCNRHVAGVFTRKAFTAHGVSAKDRRELVRRASSPAGEEPRDEHSGDDFVTSDERFDTDIRRLKADLVQRISTSGYGNAFHICPALVRALVERGDVPAAITVFEQFKEALQALFAIYPL